MYVATEFWNLRTRAIFLYLSSFDSLYITIHIWRQMNQTTKNTSQVSLIIHRTSCPLHIPHLCGQVLAAVQYKGFMTCHNCQT